jgi:hypothetical protein
MKPKQLSTAPAKIHAAAARSRKSSIKAIAAAPGHGNEPAALAERKAKSTNSNAQDARMGRSEKAAARIDSTCSVHL